MTMIRRWPFLVLVAAAAVVVMLAGPAVLSQGSSRPSRASVQGASKDGRVHVTIPEPQSGVHEIKIARPRRHPPVEIGSLLPGMVEHPEIAEPVGEPIEITTDAASDIRGVVRVRLERDQLQYPGAQDRLFLAVFDEQAGLWSPLPTTVDREQGVVVAETPHFSRFQLWQLAPVKVVARAIKHIAADVFNEASAHAPPLECRPHSLALAIAVDELGDTFSACAIPSRSDRPGTERIVLRNQFGLARKLQLPKGVTVDWIHDLPFEDGLGPVLRQMLYSYDDSAAAVSGPGSLTLTVGRAAPDRFEIHGDWDLDSTVHQLAFAYAGRAVAVNKKLTKADATRLKSLVARHVSEFGEGRISAAGATVLAREMATVGLLDSTKTGMQILNLIDCMSHGIATTNWPTPAELRDEGDLVRLWQGMLDVALKCAVPLGQAALKDAAGFLEALSTGAVGTARELVDTAGALGSKVLTLGFGDITPVRISAARTDPEARYIEVLPEADDFDRPAEVTRHLEDGTDIFWTQPPMPCGGAVWDLQVEDPRHTRLAGSVQLKGSIYVAYSVYMLTEASANEVDRRVPHLSDDSCHVAGYPITDGGGYHNPDTRSGAQSSFDEFTGWSVVSWSDPWYIAAGCSQIDGQPYVEATDCLPALDEALPVLYQRMDAYLSTSFWKPLPGEPDLPTTWPRRKG